MKRALLMLALLAFAPVLVNAKNKHPVQSARVVSQQITNYNNGAVVLPLYGGLVGAPIIRQSNIVIVDTDSARLTWSEAGRSIIVLTEGEEVNFYQSRDYFIVLDSRGRKHRFALLHAETLPR